MKILCITPIDHIPGIKKLLSSLGELTIFPEGRHEMLNEINKEEVYQLVFDWLEKKCTK